jgi:hypothetical protein
MPSLAAAPIKASKRAARQLPNGPNSLSRVHEVILFLWISLSGGDKRWGSLHISPKLIWLAPSIKQCMVDMFSVLESCAPPSYPHLPHV